MRIRRLPKLPSSAVRMPGGRRCRSPASCCAPTRPWARREIESFCLAQLARFKVPRRYVFLDSLPRNALGKVQHFRLKQQVLDIIDQR